MTTLPDLSGWEVEGRNGILGSVVATAPSGRMADEGSLLVCGGANGALLFHVPAATIRRIAPLRHILYVGVDVTDFTPHLRADGWIELFLDRAAPPA